MLKGSERLSEASPKPTSMSAWLGFGICCFALACLGISFCSPYWLQTWPMSENRFRNMGLWHVCFYDYMQFKDDSQQVYSACWWVFDPQPKYYKLREWLTPPWFITCQVLTTGSLMIEILVTVMTGLIFLHCCPLLNHEYLQTYTMFAAGSMMFLVTMILFVVGIVFGYQVNDRYWLPRPDQNYLSWGFGFMVISMICALAAGILLFKAAWDCYNMLLQKEDDYCQRALDMSAGGMELSTYPPDGSNLVPPGFLPRQPDYGDSFGGKPLLEKESLGPQQSYEKMPPKYFDEQPSLSPTGAMSIPTSEEKVALMPKMKDPDMWSPVKPEPERSYGRDLPPYSALPFGRGFEPPRDFDDGFGAKSFDQPSAYGAAGKSFDQPNKYGKSFDRNFERQYSDDSDDGNGPAKPERQY
jgi:hypothetical protein